MTNRATADRFAATRFAAIRTAFLIALSLTVLLPYPAFKAEPNANPLAADLNNDNAVDFADFFAFAEQFGQTGQNLPADLNGDNTVDFTDFFILAEQFGQATSSLLKPLTAQTAPLGSNFTLQLEATDSTTTLTQFWIAPLPLPANATFNAATGLFTFTPSTSQAGQSFTLTFAATDGALSDCKTTTITVPSPNAEFTQLSGRLLDTNAFTAGTQIPVVGAVISLLGTDLRATSDSTGHFTLTDTANTDLTQAILNINTATAQPAPDGTRYAGFREKLMLIAGAKNIIDRPFYLPRIAAESITLVDPEVSTLLTNATLGVQVEIPAGSARSEDGQLYSGELSLSEVPQNLAPAALPANLNFGLLVTIQPVGVTFDPPAPITFPNIDDLAPGNEADLWSLDPQTGRFTVVGTGRVSADGARIETIDGGVRRADWHSVSQGLVALAPRLAGADDPTETPQNGNVTASQTLCKDIPITAQSRYSDFSWHRSSAQTQRNSSGLSLVYNSLYATPRPVVALESTIPQRFAVPPLVSLRGQIAGIEQPFEIFTETGHLNENRDETIRQVAQFNAANLPTGIHPYTLTLTSHYSRSAVSSSVSGRLLVNNLAASPFGAGWQLEGIQRLYPQADGSVLLIDGNSRPRYFRLSTPGTGTFADPLRFPSGGILPRDTRVADVDNDGWTDLILINHGSDTIGLLLGDGNGHFSAPTLFDVGNGPFAAVPVDFNSDGRVDLAVTNEADDNISVLLGRGFGNFSEQALIPVGDRPIGLESGDFNSDQRQDLIVANATANTLSLLAGDGLGRFSSSAPLALTRVGFVELADFDNNGTLDIAAANYPHSDVYILLGSGDGRFSEPTVFSAGLGITSMEAADFNGDGWQDVASTNFDGDDITVLLNDTSGGLAAGINYPTGRSARDIIAGDFDVNGVPDLAVANQDDRNVSVLLGDGSGCFFPATNVTVGTRPRSLQQADFNGDDVPDLAVGNSSQNDVSILLGIPSNEEGLIGPDGDSSALALLEDGTYKLTTKIGTDDMALRDFPQAEAGAELARFFTEIGLLSTEFVDGGLNREIDYDANSRIRTIRDANGNTIEIGADPGSQDDGTTLRIECPDQTSILLEFDRGALIRAQDSGSADTDCLYTYDDEQRLVKKTCNDNTTIYTYDGNGFNTFIQANDGTQTAITAGISLGLADWQNGQGTQANPLTVYRPQEAIPVVLQSATSLTFGPSNNTLVWIADRNQPVEIPVSGSVVDTGNDLTGVTVNNTPLFLSVSNTFDNPSTNLSLKNFSQSVQLAPGPGLQPITIRAEDLSGLFIEKTNFVDLRQDTPPIVQFTPPDGAQIPSTQLDVQGRLLIAGNIEDAEANLVEVLINNVPLEFRRTEERDGNNVEGVFSSNTKEGQPATYELIFWGQVANSFSGDGFNGTVQLDLRATSVSGLSTQENHTITIFSE